MIKMNEIVGMLGDNPLLMHPIEATRMFQTIANRMNASDRDVVEEQPETREPSYAVAGGVAVIPIHGVIDYRDSLWTRWYGGTSCQTLTKQIHDALNNDEISGIVFDIDSPGGVISGVPEVAELIFKSRGVKPSIGVSNPMAASAAIWIGTACSQLICLGSGRVGSVGSFILHEEWSKYLEEVGISVNIFRNPDRKAERNPYEPLTEEAAKSVQSEVNEATKQFESAVAKHRGLKASVVHAEFGQGKMLSPKEAVGVGMIDKVGGMAEAVNLAAKSKGGASKSRRQIRRAELTARR